MAGSRRPAVLIVHERYRQSGGEDVVVAAEAALLASAGHRVETLIVDNRTIPERPSATSQLRLALDTVWARAWPTRVADAVRRGDFDIVHAHNTLPLLSPTVHRAARRAGAATVQTLHNYRLVCPAATLFRDGRPCEDCVGAAVAWPAVRHACYRGSRSQSAVVATMLATHRAARTWQGVDAFVALTDFARGRLLAGGLPPERTVVKPNFLPVDPGPGRGGGAFLVAGRLVEEKGVRTLLAALERTPQVGVRIAGTGPLEAEVRAAGAGVVALGETSRDAVLDELGSATALIVPSRWYEGFPMAVVEAFARGVPVIASRLGSLGQIVEDGRTGLHVRPGDPDDLARAVSWAADHPVAMREMGRRARQVFEERYTAAANYPQLMAIYASALERRVAGRATAQRR